MAAGLSWQLALASPGLPFPGGGGNETFQPHLHHRAALCLSNIPCTPHDLGMICILAPFSRC